MYSYKARIYSPTHGRFLQIDPAGYVDGPNWYLYAMNDPVNGRDPTGLSCGLVVGGDGLTDYDHRGGYCDDGGGYGGGFGGGLSDAEAIAAYYRAIYIAQLNAAVHSASIQIAQIIGGRQQSSPCPPPSKSVAGQVADWASWIGDRADETAVVSGGLGLITAPTGAGFALFEGTALLAGGVGRVASVVNIGANLVDGNLEGAAQGAISFIGGWGAGYATKGILGGSMASRRMFGNLSASQQRVNNVASDGVAAGYGRLVGKIGC